MNFRSVLNVFSILFIIVLLFSSLSPLIALADGPSGCRWEDGAFLCESTGKLSSGYYPFAGGSSCCGCEVKHYGTIPGDFPDLEVSTSDFFPHSEPGEQLLYKHKEWTYQTETGLHGPSVK